MTTERRAKPGEVQTVLGPVEPASLGTTLPHEHILCDVTPPGVAEAACGEQVEITLRNVHEIRYRWTGHYGNHVLDDTETATDELLLFKQSGGGAIVDVTVNGIKPDPAGLAEVSRLSGVPVVAGVGFYIESFSGAQISGRSVDELADTMIRGVTTGLGASGVRAGIIGEIGVSDPWSSAERAVMAAAVVAQKQTGASITVHPGRDPASPSQIASFVREHGGDPGRLIIGHLERTLFSYDEVTRLIDSGCVAEWDFFGIESSYYPFAPVDLPNDGQRLNLIKRLIDAGHGDRILISQDICTKTRLTRWGGHGYAHLLTAVVPMMRQKGFSEAEIDQIIRLTPARLLALT